MCFSISLSGSGVVAEYEGYSDSPKYRHATNSFSIVVVGLCGRVGEFTDSSKLGHATTLLRVNARLTLCE